MKTSKVSYIFGRSPQDKDDLYTNLLKPKFFTSPITAELTDAALKNKIIILFSQGDFSFSPLLCAILQDRKQRDMIIGLPKLGFSSKSKAYAKEYFSLSYQKVGSRFFYENTIWCNSSFQDKKDSEPVLSLDSIKTTPNWGRPQFKRDFASGFPKLIEEGKLNDWPRILSLPIKYTFPDKILDSTNFTYQGKDINLAPFDPKFVILENINERFRGNISLLEPLVRNLHKLEIGAVLHFSWPYIRGARTLLSNLSDLDQSICKIHMSKRYCLEMEKEFEKQVLELDTQASSISNFQQRHPSFAKFSIENKNWDSYYKTYKNESSLNIILSTGEPTFKDSLESLIDLDGPFDLALDDIQANLNEIRIPGKFKAMFEFPPFMNSFLYPSDLKINAPVDDTWRWLPLQDAIPLLTDSDNINVSKFVDICNQMNNVKNLTHIMQRQQTFASINKSTSLENYLYDLIFSDSISTEEEITIVTYGSRGGAIGILLNRLTTFFTEVSKKKPRAYETLGINYKIIKGSPFSNNHIINNLEVLQNSSSSSIELKISRDDGNFKITIETVSYDQLSNDMESISKKRLLLPGPLPLAYLDGGKLILPRGFDHLVKPYKEISVFVYSGHNAEQLKLQIDAINKLLYGDISDPIVQRDLSTSLEHNPKQLAVGIPGIPSIEIKKETIIESEQHDSFDQNIRDEISENFNETKSGKNIDLTSIWKKIGDAQKVQSPQSIDYENNLDYFDIKVKFINDGSIEKIKLNRNLFVDIVSDDGSRQIPAIKLETGDRFAHLETSDRSSLSDFFIQNFADEQHKDLGQIRSPFDNLFNFVDALEQVDVDSSYNDVDFTKLNWLNESERKSFFELIHYLKTPQTLIKSQDQLFHELKLKFSNSKIWNKFSLLPDESSSPLLFAIKKLFENSRDMALVSYAIAYEIYELSIKEKSFMNRLNRVKKGEPNYFFLNPNDMKSIGLLIDNEDLCLNYKDYNDSGRQISTVLQQLGVSLARVIRNEDNPMNEMDAMIRQNVKFCEVL